MAQLKKKVSLKVLTGVVIAGKIYKKDEVFEGELLQVDHDYLLGSKKVTTITHQSPELEIQEPLLKKKTK